MKFADSALEGKSLGSVFRPTRRSAKGRPHAYLQRNGNKFTYSPGGRHGAILDKVTICKPIRRSCLLPPLAVIAFPLMAVQPDPTSPYVNLQLIIGTLRH